MKPPITGRCMCGTISYQCTANPKFTLLCHCTQCQKITGTGHSAQFAMDAETTEVTGDVCTFELTSNAGNLVTSAFCGNCGNPIYKTTSMMPDTFVFHVGTLDEPGAFAAQFANHSKSAHPWDHIDPTIERK